MYYYNKKYYIQIHSAKQVHLERFNFHNDSYGIRQLLGKSLLCDVLFILIPKLEESIDK